MLGNQELPMSLESRKLIFPNANFGNNLDDLGRKQIHDVSRADFGRPEVEAHATAVSKVAVGAQVVADIDGARLVHGGGAMVVDAVM